MEFFVTLMTGFFIGVMASSISSQVINFFRAWMAERDPTGEFISVGSLKFDFLNKKYLTNYSLNEFVNILYKEFPISSMVLSYGRMSYHSSFSHREFSELTSKIINSSESKDASFYQFLIDLSADKEFESFKIQLLDGSYFVFHGPDNWTEFRKSNA